MCIQEVDSIRFISDAHRVHIKSMRIHVNATDPDWMRIRCTSRCQCESTLFVGVGLVCEIVAMLLSVTVYSLF